MAALGFSSHAPLPFSKEWCMKSDALAPYLSSIRQLKSGQTGTEIYAGLEVDYIPGQISPHQFKSQLDYTIGSIHFVDAFVSGEGWEIDGTHIAFLRGLHEIFYDHPKDAIVRYFELTRQMIQESPPDMVGHLDKIKIQNQDDKLFNETMPGIISRLFKRWIPFRLLDA